MDRFPQSIRQQPLRRRAFAASPGTQFIDQSKQLVRCPVCQRYGLGALVWSPLATGLLTGRYRKGQLLPDSGRNHRFPRQMSDERTRESIERLIPVAQAAGLSLAHLSLAFTMAHPGVTSAIIGPRTMAHLDDALAGAEVALGDEVLDKMDDLVPPGTDVRPMDANYNPPAVKDATLRRRPVAERKAI